MTKEEALRTIAAAIAKAVEKAMEIELEPGETCPCCGKRKSKRKVSERMLEANRANIVKAIEAHTENARKRRK